MVFIINSWDWNPVLVEGACLCAFLTVLSLFGMAHGVQQQQQQHLPIAAILPSPSPSPPAPEPAAPQPQQLPNPSSSLTPAAPALRLGHGRREQVAPLHLAGAPGDGLHPAGLHLWYIC